MIRTIFPDRSHPEYSYPTRAWPAHSIIAWIIEVGYTVPIRYFSKTVNSRLFVSSVNSKR